MFWRAVKREFRNQRFVFYSGCAIAALIYTLLHIGPWRKPDLHIELYRLAVSLIYMAFASFAGSLALDQNRRNSQVAFVRFLLKLIVGALSAMISGVLMVVALTLSIQLNSADTTLYSLLDTVYPDLAYLQSYIIYFSSPFITFACSTVFSLLLSRRWLSALWGFAAGTAILIATGFFWLRLDFAPWEEGNFIFFAMLLNGVLLLFFIRLFMHHSNKVRYSICLALALSAILVTAFAASVLTFFMQPSPSSPILWKPVLSSTGGDVALYATRDSNRQIWTIPTEPGRGKVIAKRYAYDADVSPDGRRISYLSQEGIFGLRSFYVDLRAATIGGTRETILLRKFARWRSDEVGIGVNGKAFSPNSKYIALLCYRVLYVIDLEGNIRSEAPIPSKSVRRLLGWRPDNSAVLILDFDRKCIEAYDLSSRQFRTIYRITQDPRLWIPIDCNAGIRFVLFGNELVDLDSGIVQLLPGDIDFPEISIDQDYMVYSFSTDWSHPEKSFARVHRLSLLTGRDELIGEFKGASAHLVISPDGSSTAVELRTGFEQLQTVVINGISFVRKFDGWGVIGWRGSQSVVLTNDRFSTKRMALGNVYTGQIHQFYP